MRHSLWYLYEYRDSEHLFYSVRLANNLHYKHHVSKCKHQCLQHAHSVHYLYDVTNSFYVFLLNTKRLSDKHVLQHWDGECVPVNHDKCEPNHLGDVYHV